MEKGGKGLVIGDQVQNCANLCKACMGSFYRRGAHAEKPLPVVIVGIFGEFSGWDGAGGEGAVRVKAVGLG